MFPEDAAGTIQRYGVDAAIQERKAEADNSERVPPAVVVILCCRTK